LVLSKIINISLFSISSIFLLYQPTYQIYSISHLFLSSHTLSYLFLSSHFLTSSKHTIREWIEVGSEAISTAFPLWVTIGCVLGLVRPSSFNWVTPKLCTMGLSVIMLGMGMTLSLDDLFGALSMPKEVLSGFFLQYSVSVPLLSN
jgi:hypothetical protein